MTESDPKTAAEPPERQAEAAARAEREKSEESECEEAVEQLAGAAGEIERLEAEKADLTDRLIRLVADMDNLRKRSEREVADAHKYASTKFAADMLVVGDNLRRALESVPADRRHPDDEAFKALLEGVEMTEREMERLLERHGVKRIAAKGERFDPHRHQAMFEVADASAPGGTVVHVAQEGYQIGDRVLRAALVGVAKENPAGESGATSGNGSAEGAADGSS